jgi:hypothetical protein
MKHHVLLWRLGLAAGFLCLTPTVRSQGTVVWDANHEEGSEQKWYVPGGINTGGGEFDSGCAGTAPSTAQNHTANGTFSLALTMCAPCDTVSVSGTRMFRWLEPRQYPDLYYKVWYYFPQSYTLTGNPLTAFWNIFQWKSKVNDLNEVFYQVNIGNRANGSMFLYMYDWQRRIGYDQRIVDVPVNQWFYIEGFYSSRGDNTGRVTIWQDGTLLWDLSGVQTKYAGGDTEWSVNNYSDGVTPRPAVFYIDDAEIRTP